MINTIHGPMNEAELAKITSTEDIPCGKAITTSYHKDGELVRQDILIEATTPFTASGHAGFFNRVSSFIKSLL